MTEQHPITPPDDLQEQWKQEWLRVRPAMTPCIQWMLAKSAQWGADQELDACCEWLDDYLLAPKGAQLRAARRPKPPSLKEQALQALDQADKGLSESEWQQRSDTIRRAIESLPE